MPLTATPDALLGAVTVLRAGLAGRSEPFASGVKVGTIVPTDHPASLPYIAIRLDGASADRRFTDPRADLRVLVWADTEENAYALARLAEALLLSHPGHGQVRAFYPLTGPTPGSDPENGLPLSVFTSEAALRPSILS